MSNIYLKVTIEKNRRYQGFDCLQVTQKLQLKQISLNFKTSCCSLKMSGLGAKVYVVFLFFLYKYDLHVKHK